MYRAHALTKTTLPSPYHHAHPTAIQIVKIFPGYCLDLNNLLISLLTPSKIIPLKYEV